MVIVGQYYKYFMGVIYMHRRTSQHGSLGLCMEA